MIQSGHLLKDLQRLLKTLEDDLRQRLDSREQAALSDTLKLEWQAARDAGRSGETYETWREAVITQAGVHWLLSCVFLRFIEDNGLVARPWLSGPAGGATDRLALARDRHEQYFRDHPHDSDREYLLTCFREAEQLPGMGAVFDERHNPVFRVGISGDAAMAVLSFWQKVDPDTGTLIHDFTDPAWNTRFLGDLYQDLSEATRKRYALLQTPEFIEEFILDRTLTPALNEFGYKEVRLIDPTCGSGHFLLGAFQRLLDVWARFEPARNVRDSAQQALNGVYGVDLNPFAIAIARFRLLVAALKACGETSLARAPNFSFNLAAGDSLLHGPELGRQQDRSLFDQAETHRGTSLEHAFASEDLADLNRILGQKYHAVVGNPPYITVKDAALNAAYRARYKACHMKYSLGVPFTERFFELAVTGDERQPAGYVGLITANSFMKREFGKKLIEEFLPSVDLTHVIDTSGAYIPGHGTPTVILFGRDRSPVGDTIRTVMGIKGEPSTPENPAQGLVWRAIVEQIDAADSESAFISVADTPRGVFAKHPWSIGGGGAVDLKELIEASCIALSSVIEVVGVFGMTNADEVMWSNPQSFLRRGLEERVIRPVVVGDAIRDWAVDLEEWAIFPYEDKQLIDINAIPGAYRWLWPARTVLGNRATFSKKTYFAEGRPWWEWHQVALDRISTPKSLTFSFVATHNHFVLDRGGRVFNRSAPIIKLPAGATEADYLGLLGLLNSSVACFWMQQVFHNKGGPGGGSSKDEKWHDFYEHAGTKLGDFPLVIERPTALAEGIDRLAQQRSAHLPKMLASSAVPTRVELEAAKSCLDSLNRQMVAGQEELDWACYRLYGLTTNELTYPHPPEIALGERAFEIVMARRMAAGEFHTSWFEWLKIKPITELPAHWPEDYRRVVEARIALIESDKFIGLIESPNCKRRWETLSWAEQEQAALKSWLLDRLETARYWSDPALTTTNKLADRARGDAEFMQVAELYAGRADFDVSTLVAELVAGESVPFLPVLRYTEAGLRKREQWEATWAMQRREDAGEKVGDIPVPPKYKSTDFLKTEFWRLRGGLDVPKERWVSYPGCERGADGSLPVAWAGWDTLKQATALAGYYIEMKENEGWEPTRLQPLLAGLLELVPWLKQWHNDYDPEHATRMGDYFEGFVADEARSLGLTLDDLRNWKPVAIAARRGRKAKT